MPGFDLISYAVGKKAYTRALKTRNDVLKAIQQFLGIFWFNNNWLPEGMIASTVSGSGYIGWYTYYAWLRTGGTADSHAEVHKHVLGLSGAYNWERKRYFGVYVRFDTYSAQNIHIVTGAAPNKGATNFWAHIGFKLINNKLYGTVGDYVAESTKLLETLSAAVWRRLECILDPTIPECRFFVDGVDKGAITTNLPTGTDDADQALKAAVHNTEAVEKMIRLAEVRVLQLE